MKQDVTPVPAKPTVQTLDKTVFVATMRAHFETMAGQHVGRLTLVNKPIQKRALEQFGTICRWDDKAHNWVPTQTYSKQLEKFVPVKGPDGKDVNDFAVSYRNLEDMAPDEVEKLKQYGKPYEQHSGNPVSHAMIFLVDLDGEPAIEVVQRVGFVPFLSQMVGTTNLIYETCGGYMRLEDAAVQLPQLAQLWGIGLEFSEFENACGRIYQKDPEKEGRYGRETKRRIVAAGVSEWLEKAQGTATDMDLIWAKMQKRMLSCASSNAPVALAGKLAILRPLVDGEIVANMRERPRAKETEAAVEQEAARVLDNAPVAPAENEQPAPDAAPKRSGRMKKIIGLAVAGIAIAALAIYGIREIGLPKMPKPAQRKQVTVLDMKTDQQGKTVRDALNSLGYNVAGIDSELHAGDALDSAQLSGEVAGLLKKNGISIRGGN